MWECLEDAEEHARTATKQEVAEKAFALFSLDTSVFLGLDIMEFRDGVPVSCDQVRNWTET